MNHTSIKVQWAAFYTCTETSRPHPCSYQLPSLDIFRKWERVMLGSTGEPFFFFFIVVTFEASIPFPSVAVTESKLQNCVQEKIPTYYTLSSKCTRSSNHIVTLNGYISIEISLDVQVQLASCSEQINILIDISKERNYLTDAMQK